MSAEVVLQAVRVLLESEGLDPAELPDLLRTAANGANATQGVTVAEFAPKFLEVLNRGTQRTYRTSLRFLCDGWSVPASEIDQVREVAAHFGADVPPARRLQRVERLPRVKVGFSRAEGPHLLVYAGCGDMPLRNLGATDLALAAKWAQVRAAVMQAQRDTRRRKAGREVMRYDGRGAKETFIAAVRSMLTHAAGDGIISRPRAEASRTLQKPQRLQPKRRMLTDEEVQASWDVTRLGGDDPRLDALLYRFHVGSGARREGALNLRLCDIDLRTSCLRLDEKGSKVRRQPVALSLVNDLRAFAEFRGATGPDDKVFRFKNGRTMTERRYDTWLRRVQCQLPWADAMGFDAHTLRHHAGSVIERIAGKAVAKRFLGHSSTADVTDSYTGASEAEVAAAVAIMTQEPHPLAPSIQPRPLRGL